MRVELNDRAVHDPAEIRNLQTVTDSCDHGNKINGKYEIKRIFANFLTQHGVVCVVCIRMGKGTGREDKLVPEKFQSTDNAGFTDAVVFTE